MPKVEDSMRYWANRCRGCSAGVGVPCHYLSGGPTPEAYVHPVRIRELALIPASDDSETEAWD